MHFWSQNTPDDFPSDMPDCGKVFNVESATILAENNEFDVEPGKYYVKTAYDPRTGIRRAVFVSQFQDRHVALAEFEYTKQGRLRRERRIHLTDNTMIELVFGENENSTETRTFEWGKRENGGSGWVCENR